MDEGARVHPHAYLRLLYLNIHVILKEDIRRGDEHWRVECDDAVIMKVRVNARREEVRESSVNRVEKAREVVRKLVDFVKFMAAFKHCIEDLPIHWSCRILERFECVYDVILFDLGRDQVGLHDFLDFETLLGSEIEHPRNELGLLGVKLLELTREELVVSQRC